MSQPLHHFDHRLPPMDRSVAAIDIFDRRGGREEVGQSAAKDTELIPCDHDTISTPVNSTDTALLQFCQLAWSQAGQQDQWQYPIRQIRVPTPTQGLLKGFGRGSRPATAGQEKLGDH